MRQSEVSADVERRALAYFGTATLEAHQPVGVVLDSVGGTGCRRLANATKFVHIRRVNGMLGLLAPTLVAPLELLGEVAPYEERSRH